MNRVIAGLLAVATAVGVAAAQSTTSSAKTVSVSRQSCQSGHWSTDQTGWSVICIDCVIGVGLSDGGQGFSFNRTYCVDAGVLPSALTDIADAGFTADGY